MSEVINICPKCGQVDHGQTGEYPCSQCGLPQSWDSPIPVAMVGKNVTEWNYGPPEHVFVFQVKGVWLDGYMMVVARNEHLARSLVCIQYTKDFPQSTETIEYKLVLCVPTNKTTTATIWDGNY